MSADYLTLISLAGETCIDEVLLIECPVLMQAVHENRSHGELIAIIEENF